MAECAKVRWDANLFFTIILAVIFGFISFVKLLVDICRKGPSRMLCGRSRDVRPDILANSAFGSHGFARLRVSLFVVTGSYLSVGLLSGVLLWLAHKVGAGIITDLTLVHTFYKPLSFKRANTNELLLILFTGWSCCKVSRCAFTD
jgi:hypothetical protein